MDGFSDDASKKPPVLQGGQEGFRKLILLSVSESQSEIGGAIGPIPGGL